MKVVSYILGFHKREKWIEKSSPWPTNLYHLGYTLPIALKEFWNA